MGDNFFNLKMKTYLLLIPIAFVFACSNISKNDKQKVDADSIKKVDSSPKNASCAKPIKDPNNPKPMALMMRMMADNADSMKVQLLRGEKLESSHYPFLRFYLLEPTDTSVLKLQFFENARLFQESYNNLFKNSNQKQMYNVVIGKCINCHEMYCNGPLKRIRKMFIDM
jgi:hypothetical protein